MGPEVKGHTQMARPGGETAPNGAFARRGKLAWGQDGVRMTAGSGHFHISPDTPAAAAIRRSRASHSAKPKNNDYRMKRIVIHKLEKELEKKSTSMVAELLSIWELRTGGKWAASAGTEIGEFINWVVPKISLYLLM